MPKISPQIKEIIKVVVFLLVAGLLIYFYVIYPLDRTEAIYGRVNIEQFDPDSLPPNDPAIFTDAGLEADSFSLGTDGLTTIACLFLGPKVDSLKEVIGTAILIHDERNDRGSMLPIASTFVEAEFGVIVYDQRACGFSGGKYRGDGLYESADLEEIIAYLDIRKRISHPLIVIGFSLGGDAALLAARNESRIDAVVAIEPYLSTERMLSVRKIEDDGYSIPFYRSVMWFWYDLQSSYESQYRTSADIEAASVLTLILASNENLMSEEYARLLEISDSDMLKASPLPASDSAILTELLNFSLERVVSWKTSLRE